MSYGDYNDDWRSPTSYGYHDTSYIERTAPAAERDQAALREQMEQQKLGNVEEAVRAFNARPAYQRALMAQNVKQGELRTMDDQFAHLRMHFGDEEYVDHMHERRSSPAEERALGLCATTAYDMESIQNELEENPIEVKYALNKALQLQRQWHTGVSDYENDDFGSEVRVQMEQIDSELKLLIKKLRGKVQHAKRVKHRAEASNGESKKAPLEPTSTLDVPTSTKQGVAGLSSSVRTRTWAEWWRKV